jgi:peptide/nickel transport system substrate-binding protein
VFLRHDRRYVPNWTGYRHDLNRSRRLLEQAGCRQGADGIYSCAGRRLSLRLVTNPGQGDIRARGVALIQSQLRRVGIEVLPSFVSPQALFGQLIPGGDFDVSYFSFITDFSSGHKEFFGCGASSNFTGYCQRLVTRDLDQADRILDADQRARILDRADRQLARDVPVLPLYQAPFVLAVRTALRSVVPSSGLALWNAEDWWLAK